MASMSSGSRSHWEEEEEQAGEAWEGGWDVEEVSGYLKELSGGARGGRWHSKSV